MAYSRVCRKLGHRCTWLWVVAQGHEAWLRPAGFRRDTGSVTGQKAGGGRSPSPAGLSKRKRVSWPVWVSDGNRPSGRQEPEVRIWRAGSDVWRLVLWSPDVCQRQGQVHRGGSQTSGSFVSLMAATPASGVAPRHPSAQKVPQAGRRQNAIGRAPSSPKLAAGYLEVHVLPFFVPVTKFERKER